MELADWWFTTPSGTSGHACRQIEKKQNTTKSEHVLFRPLATYAGHGRRYLLTAGVAKTSSACACEVSLQKHVSKKRRVKSA